MQIAYHLSELWKRGPFYETPCIYQQLSFTPVNISVHLATIVFLLRR